MSDPNFNPARYCGDAPLPPPDNRAIVDMFTPQQEAIIKKMIEDAVAKAVPPPKEASEETKTGIFARPLRKKDRQ